MTTMLASLKPQLMKAAVLLGQKEMVVQEVPRPKIQVGTLLVRVKACGICGSDLRIFETGNSRVHYPSIIGHEIAGDIVVVGKGVKKWREGDRVSIGADVPCGKCQWCKSGQNNCCDTNLAIGYQFAGGFAEYCLLKAQVVKEGPVCKIPKSLSYSEAALAEPLGCCINGMERVHMSSGKSVLIIGSGPVGLMLLALSKFYKAGWTAIADLSEKRLRSAKQFHPDKLILTSKQNLVETIQDETHGKGIDVIFSACPSSLAQEQALQVVSKRGVINFFGGLSQNAAPIQLYSNILHYKEATLTGSHGSTPRQHEMALHLISSGKLSVKSLITNTFPLTQIHQGFQTVKNQDGLKVVISP